VVTPVAKEAGPEELLVHTEGHLARIVLNRPAKRNALTTAMRRALDQSLAALQANEDVRVVILTGSGGSFCAGVDLADQSGTDQHVLSARPQPVAEPLGRFAKPLVAAIDGPAYGGGLELALACDVRVASHRATFALPEARIGSLPGSGGTQRLPRLVPAAVASRMLLTGNPIDADEALRIGLVSDLADEAELLDLATSIAQQIAANAPLSVRAVKQCIGAAYETSLTSGLELERSLWGQLATTNDRQEGRAAFRERRPPRFSGS
jgi:enoyl-CoA hydratase/carnithine racemase